MAENPAGFDAIVRATCERAEARWPRVALDRASFERWLEGRWPEGPEKEVRTEDLWLACACAAGDSEAVRVLEAELMPQAERALERIGIPPAHRAEAIQHLLTDLLSGDAESPPRIGTYRGTGPLAAWLRVAAVRTAKRAQSRAAREIEWPADGSGDELDSDPELAFFKAKYRAEFKQAFGEAVAGLSAQERNMMRFSLVERLSIDRLAAIYKAHRSTMARQLTRIRQEVVDATRRGLAQRLGMRDPSELDGIAPLFESQVDLSLTRLLAAPEAGGEGSGEDR